ncbi:MAG: hypothetical protein WC785_00730 [Tatlockia sp.]|jgi:hypothetical protein
MLYIKVPEHLVFIQKDGRDCLENSKTKEIIDLQSIIHDMLKERGGKKTTQEVCGEITFHFKNNPALLAPYLKYQINNYGKSPSPKVVLVITKPAGHLTSGYGQNPFTHLFGEKRKQVDEKRKEKKNDWRTKGPSSN